jgi:hypothetical protein
MTPDIGTHDIAEVFMQWFLVRCQYFLLGCRHRTGRCSDLHFEGVMHYYYCYCKQTVYDRPLPNACATVTFHVSTCVTFKYLCS